MQQNETSTTNPASSEGNKGEQKDSDNIEECNEITSESGMEYKLESVIGRGTFGLVYLACNKKNPKEKFAIKRYFKNLHPNLCQLEISILSYLNQKTNADNILKLYDGFIKNQDLFLIMSYQPHQKFSEYYGDLALNKLKLYMKALLSALNTIHKLGIVHRDIKPGNLMIEDGLKVRLIDFGVSKIASHTSTFTKAQIGTVPYMSPEQFQIDLDRFSDPNIDDVKPVPISTKSDIWSLGVMISEIFSGIKPYFNLSKKRSPTEQMITGRLTGNKPFPIPNNLDDDIKEVVKRATEVNPEKRATASEIKTMIKALMDKKKNETETKIDSNKESESNTIVTQPETKNI